MTVAAIMQGCLGFGMGSIFTDLSNREDAAATKDDRFTLSHLAHVRIGVLFAMAFRLFSPLSAGLVQLALWNGAHLLTCYGLTQFPPVWLEPVGNEPIFVFSYTLLCIGLLFSGSPVYGLCAFISTSITDRDISLSSIFHKAFRVFRLGAVAASSVYSGIVFLMIDCVSQLRPDWEIPFLTQGGALGFSDLPFLWERVTDFWHG